MYTLNIHIIKQILQLEASADWKHEFNHCIGNCSSNGLINTAHSLVGLEKVVLTDCESFK
jgi:hypothetical protein